MKHEFMLFQYPEEPGGHDPLVSEEGVMWENGEERNEECTPQNEGEP